MYRAYPQKRSRLSHFESNGVVRESRRYTSVGSKRKQTQNPTPSYDERFPWGMSETSIIRWVLGICCLFLLFPGTKCSLSIFIFFNIIYYYLDCHIVQFSSSYFYNSEAMGNGPKFIGELQNVTVSMGREATFTCTVTRLGGHRVSSWTKER